MEGHPRANTGEALATARGSRIIADCKAISKPVLEPTCRDRLGGEAQVSIEAVLDVRHRAKKLTLHGQYRAYRCRACPPLDGAAVWRGPYHGSHSSLQQPSPAQFRKASLNGSRNPRSRAREALESCGRAGRVDPQRLRTLVRDGAGN